MFLSKNIVGGVNLKTVPIVKQETKTDCGIACLLALIRYYDKEVPRSWLYQESKFQKNGVSMYGLQQAAIKLGFQATGVECLLAQIKTLSLPAIAHIKIEDALYHFVVILEVGDDQIKIMDPAIGYQKITLKKFQSITTNYYLLLQPTSTLHSIVCYSPLTNCNKKFLKQNKGVFGCLLILIIVTIILEFCLMFQFKIILNIALLPAITNHLWKLLFVFTMLLCLHFFAQVLLYQYQSYFYEEYKSTLTKKFYHHFLTLPVAYYQLQEQGYILSLLDDIEWMSKFIAKIYTNFLMVICLLFIFNIYLYYLSKAIFLFLLLGQTLFILLVEIEKKVIRKQYEKVYQTKKQQYQLETELFQTFDRTKGLHIEKLIQQQLYKQFKKTLIDTKRLEIYQQNYSLLYHLLEKLVCLILIIMSGYLYIRQKINVSFSTFVLLETALLATIKNNNSLLFFYLEYQLYKESYHRLQEFFLCQPEKLLMHPSFPKEEKINCIEFINVSFSYADKIVLKNSNLTIREKQKVCIYGKSGSGKSTLVKLLGRYYALENGYIKINYRNINYYNLDTLRKMIGYMNPNGALLKGSIQQMILLNRKLDVKRLNEIIYICTLDEVMKNKNLTLESIIETNCPTFSSGERQRLLLAQGLYQDYPLYILDECLSMVDIKTERKIIKRLCNFNKNKIIIYISHRIHPKLFDRYIEIEKGICYEKKEVI